MTFGDMVWSADKEYCKASSLYGLTEAGITINLSPSPSLSKTIIEYLCYIIIIQLIYYIVFTYITPYNYTYSYIIIHTYTI